MASSQNGNLGVWSGYTPGDNGWTTQHNNNWDALDALVQPWIISNVLTTPPGSPAIGDSYIVPSGATGAWASQTNKIAAWQRGAWAFYTPKNGWQAYNRLDGGDYLYNGTSWVLQGGPKLNVPQDYISGLTLVWNSATSISVTNGSAYVPSLGRLVQPAATLTLSSLSLTASTFYHVYLFDNSGTPAIECVTTAPAAAYNGTARAKTGDTSRRYIGSVLTDGSSNVIQFKHAGNKMLYSSVGTFSRVVTNASATTSTQVSCSAFVPVTTSYVYFKLQNNGPSATSVAVTPGDVTASATTGVLVVGGVTGAALITFGDCPVDSSQRVAYACDATGGTPAFFLTVINYTFER